MLFLCDCMDISKLEPGNKEKINVFLQSVKGSKDFYEYDEKSQIFILRKTLNVEFPGNYGIVPKTHHVDAEPLEVLVLTDRSLQQGTVVEVRPIGIIRLKGQIHDDILIGLAVEDKKHENIKDLSQLQNALIKKLKDFLEEFKNLEIENTFDSEHAMRAVEHSIELYKKQFD